MDVMRRGLAICRSDGGARIGATVQQQAHMDAVILRCLQSIK